MKKINLRGISEILSEKELKNVMGGSSGSAFCYDVGPPYKCCYMCMNGNEGGIEAYSRDDLLDVFGDSCSAGGYLYFC